MLRLLLIQLVLIFAFIQPSFGYWFWWDWGYWDDWYGWDDDDDNDNDNNNYNYNNNISSTKNITQCEFRRDASKLSGIKKNDKLIIKFTISMRPDYQTFIVYGVVNKNLVPSNVNDIGDQFTSGNVRGSYSNIAINSDGNIGSRFFKASNNQFNLACNPNIIINPGNVKINDFNLPSHLIGLANKKTPFVSANQKIYIEAPSISGTYYIMLRSVKNVTNCDDAIKAVLGQISTSDPKNQTLEISSPQFSIN
jgi:hypothetical protein